MPSKLIEKLRDAERKQTEALYWGIVGLGAFHEDRCALGLELTAFKLRPPRAAGDDWMIVLTANRMGEAKVMYISGGKPEELVIKALGHLERGDGEWRDDKFAR